MRKDTSKKIDLSIAAEYDCRHAFVTPIFVADTFTYAISDGHGGTDTANVTVTVQDTQPPTVTASIAVSSLWPANHNLINVGLTVNSSDNSGGPVATQVFVFGDEDDQTPTAPGQIDSPDAKNIAPNTLRLRSERIDSQDGRVYLIVVVATDSSGNVSHTCVTVVVPINQSSARVQSVNAQAAAARAYCESHGGAPPPGYFVIGDGPVIGPKQ